MTSICGLLFVVRFRRRNCAACHWHWRRCSPRRHGAHGLVRHRLLRQVLEVPRGGGLAVGVEILPESERLYELASLVVEKGSELGLTVGTAESCTGGLVAGCLTAVPGSSSVVRGGVVSYAIPVKHGVLGVSQQVLDEPGVGAVSSECACQMAEAPVASLGATWPSRSPASPALGERSPASPWAPCGWGFPRLPASEASSIALTETVRRSAPPPWPGPLSFSVKALWKVPRPPIARRPGRFCLTLRCGCLVALAESVRYAGRKFAVCQVSASRKSSSLRCAQGC